LTATTTYYAQARNNTTGCVSTTRLAVTGTVHTVPAPPAMPGSSSYCTSGTITAAYGNGGNGIRWDNGSTVTSRPVTATGTYRAVTTSAAGCTSSTATINVTVTLPGTLGNTTNACGCTSGLTACNGYCRNLAADNAVCYKNIEYKVGCLTTDIVPCTSPAGWSQAPLYISDTRAVVLLLNSPLTFWAIETNGSQCRWTVNATVIACTTGGGTQSRYWFYGR
jgi:hypothetical protein